MWAHLNVISASHPTATGGSPYLLILLPFCLLFIFVTTIRFIPSPRPSLLASFSISSRPLIFSVATLSPPLSFPRASSPPSSLPDLCRFLIRARDAGLLSGVKWPADSAEHWALHRWPWAPYDLSDMLSMNLEGLEMIAVLVVVVLFVKVLEQFGLLESGYDGKGTAKSFLSCHSTTCCWKFVKAECSLLQ